MSAIPSEIRFGGGASGPEPPRRELLPIAALVYLVVVVGAAAAVATPFLPRLDRPQGSWVTFLVLAGSAAVAQIFLVRTGKNLSYQTSIVFLIPAALLLPPELVALVPLVQYLPDWLKNRTAWYIQIFNISNFTLAILAASGGAHLVQQLSFGGYDEMRFAVSGLTACVLLVGINHSLLAPMLALARGHSLRESGLFSFQSLSTDLVLAALGVGIATFWDSNPWLVPFAVAPLVLIHRSLAVPKLEAEARVDPKTGLFNARHFGQALNEELTRAARFDRPLSLIMADLDLLREINNTYGHLAGDAVLKGIAEVFRAMLRHYDVPARF